ncbi:glycoside hydrolase family 13 protein [Litorihabitans aurantiacus]|uniref:Glucohydrolase n=1 Tax=Litorihabitans aurantiacus TaxID=1930061 RepID=A0AA38CS29_9MICO|nr:alpha-glucosidase [Litorihabitans aurantiacus]GMA33308.1 glucohydrolase [Litorihabitans aurantiacus]
MTERTDALDPTPGDAVAPPGNAASQTRTSRRDRRRETRRPWWHTAVVYQVYPRSFADTNGDGVGDIPGITSRLDHLAELGVDVVWLSPVYRSPHDDNGYDISDYTDVDPLFGSLDDLDHLIAEAAERDIGIVMDLVVNHTSDEHEWFRDSASSADSVKRDWYWWRPARPGTTPGEPGAEPTNWGSFFSGSAWQYDEASGEYYLHLFSRKQPDLNWENPEVRAEVYAMMRSWLARGVAGFRMDVINLISKRVGPGGALADGPERPDGWGDGSAQYVDGPRMHAFLAEMHEQVFDAFPGTYLTVAETPGVTLEQAREYTDPERREVDMVFQFEHVGLDHGPGGKFDPRPLHLPDLKANLARWQEGLAETGWNSLYLGNHDQPRAVSRWGDDGEHRVVSAKTLALVLHLHRGTPYVYQGEELGMPNAGFTALEQYRDLESLNYAADAERRGLDADDVLRGLAAQSRDNARTPVPWDDSPHGGFTTGEPWIAMTPGWERTNARAQRADQGSVFHHYRRLIELRHTDPVVVDGAFALLAPEHESLWAFTRTTEDSQLVVLANLSGGELAVDLAAIGVEGGADLHDVAVASHAEAARPDGEGRIVLRPWESVVFRRAV